VSLSRIQQRCTGTPDFVVGQVYGLRQWQWSPLTESLHGHQGARWLFDGPLEAECRRTYTRHTLQISLSEVLDSLDAEAEVARRIDHYLQVRLPPLPIMFYTARLLVGAVVLHEYTGFGYTPLALEEDLVQMRWLPHLVQRARPHISRAGGSWHSLRMELEVLTEPVPHDVTDPNCTCGIYAYTDPKSLLRNSRRFSLSVFGLVKAYGLVTQGTHGFRAQKAEIIALTTPQQSRLDWHQIPVDDPDVLGFRPSVPRNIPLLPSLDALFDHARPYLEESRLEP
jgi:hypothetical protein